MARLGIGFSGGPNASEIVACVKLAESLGYDHLLVYDHVLGANAASRPGWRGAYRHTDSFLEPFVLFGYLAGLTERLELATGILILPQRQTTLVAKQAAAVDVISGGRLRLGIGVGWNRVEYEALGQSFHDRGVRSEEQIGLLRALWTHDLVTFEGRWHKITDAGLNPMPVQRPIPIWLGGSAEPVLRRIGRLADGWVLPGGNARPDHYMKAMIDRVHAYATESGRDPSEIGLEKVVSFKSTLDEVRAWEDAGITHLSVNTMGARLSSPDGHIAAIRRFIEAAKDRA